MNTVFALIFIVGCIGTWYFIKKKQNKKNRNISIGLILLSILLMSIFPSPDSKESAKSSDKDTKSSTKISSKNEALSLTVPKEVLSNDDGLIAIKGNTSPHAEVTIGMGVVGDKTTANKSGDFELSYDMDFQDETTLTINSRLDGDSKSSKVKVKMNETALARLEQKEIEASKDEESKEAENQRTEESKKDEKQKKKESSKQKYLSVNKDIAAHLAEDQGFATGSLDKDGNPTENGNPNTEFNWALFISKVEYNEDGLDIYVNENFLSLNKADRKEVINTAQSAAAAYIGPSEDWQAEEYRNGLFSTIKSETEIIGSSRVLDVKDYKWEDIK